MRKKLHYFGTLTAVTFFACSALAQESGKKVNSIEKNPNGLPNFVSFKENAGYKSSDFQTIFKEQLHLKQGQNFSKVKSDVDQLGFTHEKFQLFHQGLKVEFATYTLHSKNGKVTSMSGEFYTIGTVNTRPSLSSQDAFNKAVALIGAKSYMWDNPIDSNAFGYAKPQGELVLLPIDEEIKLAYKFDIYATQPVSRGDIYIDASTGESLFYNATIKHLDEFSHGNKTGGIESVNLLKKQSMLVAANAATRYSGAQVIETSLNGSSYILSENARGNGILTLNMRKGTNYSAAVNFTDVDNNWTAAEFNNTNKDNAALDAHWGAEKTYDYWKNVHGRNSYDNLGATLKNYVHYSSNYDNAYWNGSVMTYGDGSGTYFDALTSVDVAGHEIGHAVCEKTANLAYQLESGAMNEGFSDIWGACIEYYAAPTKQRWLIGEDIERRSGHVSLRSMSNPNVEGQPDTYGGTYWVNQSRCRPRSGNDYCGVHTNSGVLNHWFYILTEGKTGTNDLGNSYTVTGIGIDKAAKIAYRLESVYLSANSNYSNARTYGIQAATDLFGAGSPEVIATTNAWYAVGVGSASSALVQEGTPVSTSYALAAERTEIKAFPNPFENVIYISIDDNQDTSFKITNLLGQVVMGGKLRDKTINVENLSKGMYVLELSQDDAVVLSEKVIKK